MCYLIPGKGDAKNPVCNHLVIIPPVLMPYIGYVITRFAAYVKCNINYIWTVDKIRSSTHTTQWCLLASETYDGPILFRFKELIYDSVAYLCVSYKKESKYIAPALLLNVMKELEQIEIMLIQIQWQPLPLINQFPSTWSQQWYPPSTKRSRQWQQPMLTQVSLPINPPPTEQPSINLVLSTQTPLPSTDLLLSTQSQKKKCWCPQLITRPPLSTQIPLPTQLLTLQEQCCLIYETYDIIRISC